MLLRVPAWYATAVKQKEESGEKKTKQKLPTANMPKQSFEWSTSICIESLGSDEGKKILELKVPLSLYSLVMNSTAFGLTVCGVARQSRLGIACGTE